MPSPSTLLLDTTTTDSSNFLPALHHALSGSAGTLVSTCTLHPLSQVITWLHLQRLRHDGKASKAGKASTAPTSTEAAPDHQQQQQQPQTPDHQGPQHGQSRENPNPSPSSSLKPSPNNPHPGVVDSFLQTLRSDGSGGPRALYTGLAHDAARSVLDSFLFFLFYEWFRSMRLSRRRRGGKARGTGTGMGVVEELALGMVAGACSQVFTTPIANITARRKTARYKVAVSEEVSVRSIVHEILQDEGITGFWSGYSASLVLALNPSITFFLQDFLGKQAVAKRGLEEAGSAPMTFLIAAVSKTVATALTYPFQTARARLQAGIPVELPTAPLDAVPNEAELESPVPEHRDVDREVDAKLKAIRAVQKFTKQSIFGTIVQIARLEGVGSLYHGLRGELLRGFFGHGTTMVAKGVAHRLLFKLYLFSLGVMAELRARRASRAASADVAVMPRDVPMPAAARPDRGLLPDAPTAAVRPDRMLEGPPAGGLAEAAAVRPDRRLEGIPERIPERTPVREPFGEPVGSHVGRPVGNSIGNSIGNPAGNPVVHQNDHSIGQPFGHQARYPVGQRAGNPIGRPEGRPQGSLGESMGEALQQLPRALQYRLDRSQIVAKPRSRGALELGLTNVVANMIDGSHRGFDQD
ncbi:mitochondrial carrier domain-containing protein [Xylariaceae sp. FL0662B]|nr:mitochondrial carrier domain-containing protein [Xylariaceae sp. FL0662B]